MPPTVNRLTAAALLNRVRGFGPAVEGAELVFAADPPADLLPALAVLHTGVRAALAGRPWWGVTTGRPRTAALDPAAPLPAGLVLLCVEGDGRWDRVDPAARLDLPALFAPG